MTRTRHTDGAGLQTSGDPSPSGTADGWRDASTETCLTEPARLRSEAPALKSPPARHDAELDGTPVAAGWEPRVDPARDGALHALQTRLAATAAALAEAEAAFREASARIAELDRALREKDEEIRRKDLLNREIGHRVKNSLQDIIGLLRLQFEHGNSPQAMTFTEVACTRLQALATMHDLLHAGGDSDAIDFRTYLERLCGCLREAMGADGTRRTLILEAVSLMLPGETAQALALAVNELVTNAFRHAFPAGAPGTVRVRLSRRGRTALLAVSDDGRGVPEGFDLTACDGLGLRLVAMMAGQLRAEVAVSKGAASGTGGCRFTIAVPLQDRRKRAGTP